MKKKTALLSILPALLLTSCGFLDIFNANTDEKTMGVYVLDLIAYDDNPQLSKARVGDLTPRFKNGEKYIPYLTLKQYASIYNKFFEEGVVSEVTTNGYISQWTIEKNNELYFAAAISPLEKTIIKAGDISNVLRTGEGGITPPLDVLSYGVESNQTYEQLGTNNYSTFTYKDCDFDYFRNDGELYLPLGLLDLSFSESSGLFVTYNYKNLYASTDANDFGDLAFRDGLSYTSVDDQMVKAVGYSTMPDYLIKYNASAFLFVMQNFYGLRKYHNIDNMKQFYKSNGLYDKFYSAVASTRGYAFSEAVNLFDDNHTGVVRVNSAWGENVRAPYASGIVARNKLEERLKVLRKEKYQGTSIDYEPAEGDIRYSDDGKTAMFFFDAFKYGTYDQVFTDDGRVKANAYKYDTFFLFRDTLKEIATHTSVENVIIDVSLNGGGTLGVLIKLLPLLSKNNQSTINFYDDSEEIVFTYRSSSDINGDGLYNQNDAYGNRFNFYILTSDCSFSCGNAFPCYAQAMGVKIIGENSGGGECAVAIHYLPNSQYVYHSSNLHLGIFDQTKKEFHGFENGADPDIPLTELNQPMCTVDDDGNPTYHIPGGFYDINSLNEKIIEYANK